MAEFGICLAEKLIEIIGSAVIKEICDMWGYEAKLDELMKIVSDAKDVLRDAEAKVQLPNKTRRYIEELKDAVYDADDLFDEFLTLAELKLLDGNKDNKILGKVWRFFKSKKYGISEAHRMSRQVKKIKKQLDAIVSDHKKFDLSVDNNPISNKREETCSYVDAKIIIGRDNDIKAVIDMLLGPNDVNENFRFVTIVGMGGLGKTALAQLVCNDKKVEKEFPDPKLRLWVCVSDQGGEQFDVKVILCKILELVSGIRLDRTSTLEWVQKQFQEQLKGKKYLLVLDDVWSEDCEEWRRLQSFLTLGQEGSRIIVTTRSEMIAEIIGEKYTHKLQGLSEENSWLLFESVAFNKGEQEQVNYLELVDIGKKFIENCSNTPLAIKVVGSLLFGQPLNKWQAFEQSGLAGIEKGGNKIMSILKLSYHNLSPSLKNCFSYCSLFPKDYQLDRKELISLWMAQGYIVSLDRDQSIEDAAEEHFLILLRRCFFQDVMKDEYGDIQSVKIHDLMHDVAQEVGKEEIGVVSSNTIRVSDKIRHVYYVGDSCPQSSLLESKIRSFILSNDIRGLMDPKIGNCVCLRVLNLQFAEIRSIPNSIAKLLHLRYLNLYCNSSLEVLSDSITKLHNLQTLVLNTCYNLRELPKDFSKLVKLRHLDLSGCSELTGMPSGMDKLTNLRYLNLNLCWGLSSMPSGIDKLTSLRVLPFFVVGKGERVSAEEQNIGLKDLIGLTNLKGGIKIEIGENYVNDGEGDYLRSMKHLSEVQIVFYKDELQSLLQITRSMDNDDGCLECEAVMEKLKPPSNLKGFILENYEGTTIPRWGRAEDDWAISFQYLVNIEIKFCSELEQIPLLSKLRYLKSLSFWSLLKLEYMENRSNNTSRDGEELTTFFPSLESLQISDLGCLKGWCRGEEYKAEKDDDHILSSRLTFPSLSKLMIEYCYNLTSFPSCPSLEDLKFCCNNKRLPVRVNEVDCDGKGEARLRKVEIDEVGYLRSIHSLCLTVLDIKFNENVESLSEFGEVFKSCASSLRSLNISLCSNLRRFGRGGLEHLTALESLRFYKNDQLSFAEDEVDDDGMPWKSLNQNLRSLQFSSLENMKSLPKGIQYLNSLRSLTFYDCENFIALPEWISCLSSLQSLSIKQCSAIKSIPESMRNLTSLQKLIIDSCSDLAESCKKPNGKDWPKIKHIPYIDFTL